MVKFVAEIMAIPKGANRKANALIKSQLAPTRVIPQRLPYPPVSEGVALEFDPLIWEGLEEGNKEKEDRKARKGLEVCGLRQPPSNTYKHEEASHRRSMEHVRISLNATRVTLAPTDEQGVTWIELLVRYTQMGDGVE